MEIKDKIKKIKSNRLTEYDKFLMNIFSNLIEVSVGDYTYYINNGNVYLKRSNEYNNILYDLNTIHKPLEIMKLSMKEIIDLMEKYIKGYLNLENTIPWKANGMNWDSEIIYYNIK